MERKLTTLLLVFLLAAMAGSAHGLTATATIAGVVQDGEAGPLPGVTVTLTSPLLGDEPLVAYADGTGSFTLSDLLPGTYTVTASLDGFQPVTTEVTVVVNQKLTLEFKLAMATLTEQVEVVAEAPKSSEVSLLDERRQAGVVSDSISAEEISKSTDSDAASVVDRLTGISVLDDKYVYVRGLGERYSNTTLNGATLATTETEKRVVPLDLFPAKLLDTIDVVKTYTPDKPGSFGSGVVELNTLNFPTTRTIKFSTGLTYDSSATGDRFRSYAGGLDWLGRGGQPLPAGVPGEKLGPKSRFNPDGYSPEQLQTIGRSFGSDWTGSERSTAPYNGNYSLTYGDTIGRLGVIVSAVNSHGYDSRDEVQRYFGLDSGDVLVPNNDYSLTTTTEKVRNGMVGALSYRIADGHRLQLSSVFTRDASSSNRIQEGYQAAGSYDVRDYRTRYEKEDLLTTKLSGEHFFSGLGQGSSIDWSYARSRGTRDSDLRENLYAQTANGDYALLTGYPEVGKMEFHSLEDRVDDGGLSWTTYYASDANRYGSVKVGTAYNKRERDFTARRFKFITNDPNQFDLTLLPDELFVPANIRPDGFEIREVTGLNDAYTGEHTIAAAYAMADATFGKWRLIGGVRFEDSDQSVTTVNPFDASSPEVATNVNRDWLPGLNAVYMISGRTNLRFAASRTVNRPEFRELSPYAFVEVTGGRSVAGNPDLVQASIDSFDVRWETFPDAGEVMAVSVFYKRITDPIERYVQATSELRTSWINADTATLKGIEIELRRSLGILTPFLRNWSANLNYSYVDSDVTVPDSALSVITNTNRTLQGQAKHVGNVALQFYKPTWGTLARLLYNYTGTRLTDVGAYGLPDIYESSFDAFDLVVSQQLPFVADGLEVKLTGSNLLDKEHEYTQGSETQHAYKSGRSYGFSIGYTF